MQLESLRLFLHLSRSLHFGHTSRDCHVSPSALSRTIQRLERELGASLFERDNRSVELTAAGRVLQRYASQTLSGWDGVREELRRAGESLSGTLTVFCSVTASHSVLPQLLSRFRQSYPDVTLRLETGYAANALETLQAGAVDVTVAALPERVPRGLLSHSIVDTPLLFVGPVADCEVARMIEGKSIDWSAVPMVLPEFGLAREGVDRWFRRRGVVPRIYSEVSGNEAALSLVSLGCGVGIVPELVLSKSPLRARVRGLDVRPALPPFRVGVATRRANLRSAVVAAFWGSVTEGPRGAVG